LHDVRTDIQSVSEVVREAAAICDPDGHDDVVNSLRARFEDDDRPALGVDDLQGELRGMLEGVDPEGDSPAAQMTAAVATFLAASPAEADRGDAALRHAAKVWFGDDPPEPVRDWLRDQGVEV
jgi:hypothetical protein